MSQQIILEGTVERKQGEDISEEESECLADFLIIMLEKIGFIGKINLKDGDKIK